MLNQQVPTKKNKLQKKNLFLVVMNFSYLLKILWLSIDDFNNTIFINY
jgi:hypothetical protein